MIPPAKSIANTPTAALTIVQNNIFMLLSSDVIAVYRHMPHMMKANKAIKIYKMNFIFFTSKLYSSNTRSARSFPSHYHNNSVFQSICMDIPISAQKDYHSSTPLSSFRFPHKTKEFLLQCANHLYNYCVSFYSPFLPV